MFSFFYLTEKSLSMKAYLDLTDVFHVVNIFLVSPYKHKIKCYVLCYFATRYCLKLKIYTGRDITFDKTLPYNYPIVMDLISPNYLHGSHKLYIDNYYTSLKLAADLKKKKTDLI